MNIEQDIDSIIEDIEKEWHDNGYFGEVREDPSLIYEVVIRILSLQNKEHANKED